MPISMDKTGGIPALTGIRFFAALMVFFSHYPIAGSGELLRRFQDAGYSGVTFFFILSGFIITYNYLDKLENHNRGSISTFYIARFCRIYPLYSFCAIYAWSSSIETIPLWPHLLAVQAWSGDTLLAMGFNGPGWSISVEAFLYLMFPLLLPVMHNLSITESKTRLASFAILLFCCQLALALYFWLSGKAELSAFNPESAHRWLYRTPVTRLFDFCIGICAAVYYKRFMQCTHKSRVVWSVVTYLSLFIVLAIMGWKQNYRSAFSWDVIYVIPFTLLIIGVSQARHSFISKALSTKTACLLGEASFALYLIHTLMRGLYIARLPESFLYSLMQHAFFLVIVIIMSIGLHLAVEKPAQKILKSLLTKKTTKCAKVHPVENDI
jgi:peptidoglycan/LPS O-acetylase OafA/YrhL